MSDTGTQIRGRHCGTLKALLLNAGNTAGMVKGATYALPLASSQGHKNQMASWYGIYMYIYTHNGILPSHRKNKILPLQQHGWPENIILCEINQKEKDSIIVYHLYVKSKNKWVDLVTQKQTHECREQAAGLSVGKAEERWDKGRGLVLQATVYKLVGKQGCIVQHREA